MSTESSVKTSEKVWLEIHRDALKFNARRIRQIIGADVFLLAMVKADAYGLGLLEISRELRDCGVSGFGVSNIEEGVLLRKQFSTVPILITGPSFLDNIEGILQSNLIPFVASLDLLRKLNEVALLKSKKAKVHLMIDTGMGRLGIWHEKGEDFFKELLKLKNIELEGVASHLATADSKEEEFVHVQLKRFQDFLFKLKVMGCEIPLKHIANSSAILKFPDSFFNMVRVGLLFYGIYPSEHVPKDQFKPVLSWKTRIAFIKEVEPGRTVSYGATFVADQKTRIATLPVGYFHGYPRSLSNRGEVLVNGERCRVVGRVTMDQIMVDLGPESQAKVDEEVILAGAQGDQSITFEEMAEKAGTIPYEILTRLKVKKVWVR